MKYMFIFFISIVMISCNQNKESKDGFYGNSFEVVETISVNEMVNRLNESQALEDLVVNGTIEDVCQAKGCWLTLKTENGEDVRVTFKDYGFFVPMDVSGKSVVIKGKGQIETTSVADLQHFAKDEGQTDEEIAKITESLEEFTFVAEGVKIK